ncbi:MAG: MarC family protein [Pseudomonadota bacterium]
MTTDAMLNAFATFFVTIDPPGQIAIFLALTAGMSSAERKQVALRGTLIGLAIILGFMLVGGALLDLLGISMPAFRVAGGLLLFYTAFEMVFEKRKERKEETAKRALSKSEIQSLAVFPLAIPLIAGPGAISAAILLANDFPWPYERIVLIAILLLVGLMLYIGLWLADRLNKYMGETGQIVLTRLLGIILAALSIQFIADGVLTMAQG